MIGRIKYILASFLSVWVLCLAAAPVASAFSLFPSAEKCDQYAKNNSEDDQPTVCEDKNDDNSVNRVLALVVNILSIVIGVAAVIVLIIAGIQYMISTGDPTKVNNAKNAILYALIGLAVAAFARIIVVFVINKL